MDFTIITYKKLLDALKKQGFAFQTFAEFIQKPAEKVIVLRQDVDRLPENSLQFARIQAGRGIKGTYYFRIVPGSWDERIIREIYDLGHEIGYHYEDVSLAAKKQMTKDKCQNIKNELISDLQDRKTAGPQDNGRIEKELAEIAIESFSRNLQKLRELAPIKTICMHGSPLSKWDSRILWKYYDYHDFGLIGEPYFDVDFDEVLYLTDTGRRWNGSSVNIRDKSINRKDCKESAKFTKDEITPSPHRPFAPSPTHPLPPSSLNNFHSTYDIINSAVKAELPDRIMMTFHPQRWTNEQFPWVRELVWQNVKNVGKYFVGKIRTV